MITSWGTTCGIAQHSALIKEGIEAADPSIDITPCAESLDPEACRFKWGSSIFDLVFLNYHAALHSRWTPEQVTRLKNSGVKVVVTYHDTMSGEETAPNSLLCKSLNSIADAFIVHEPVEDLPGAIHWRHGVPAVQLPSRIYDRNERPIIGSAGFNFGWKNYDLLCEAAALVGWRVLLIGPNFTFADVKRWQQWQPTVVTPVLNEMPTQKEVVAYLSACDATAFLHNNANTGVSGSVRFGIAARKPCLLMDDCRQFRDLMFDPGLRECFSWTKYHTETIAEDIARLPSVRFDHGLCAVAERDSYVYVGEKYAALFKEMVAR